MSSWTESGAGEHLSIADILEPLRLYLEAALGSDAEAEEAICELFESLMRLHPEQQPKTKGDWFKSIDTSAIQWSRSTLENEKRILTSNPALSRLFQRSTHSETLFLTRWLNAGAISGKGQC